ncbi:hypothetical protein ACQRKX_004900, partial [Enterobacter cloacae]
KIGQSVGKWQARLQQAGGTRQLSAANAADDSLELLGFHGTEHADDILRNGWSNTSPSVFLTDSVTSAGRYKGSGSVLAAYIDKRSLHKLSARFTATNTSYVPEAKITDASIIRQIRWKPADTRPTQSMDNFSSFWASKSISREISGSERAHLEALFKKALSGAPHKLKHSGAIRRPAGMQPRYNLENEITHL